MHSIEWLFDGVGFKSKPEESDYLSPHRQIVYIWTRSWARGLWVRRHPI